MAIGNDPILGKMRELDGGSTAHSLFDKILSKLRCTDHGLGVTVGVVFDWLLGKVRMADGSLPPSFNTVVDGVLLHFPAAPAGVFDDSSPYSATISGAGSSVDYKYGTGLTISGASHALTITKTSMRNLNNTRWTLNYWSNARPTLRYNTTGEKNNGFHISTDYGGEIIVSSDGTEETKRLLFTWPGASDAFYSIVREDDDLYFYKGTVDLLAGGGVGLFAGVTIYTNLAVPMAIDNILPYSAEAMTDFRLVIGKALHPAEVPTEPLTWPT